MLSKNLQYINNENLKSRLAKLDIENSSKNISYCMSHSNDYILLINDVPMDDLSNPREAIKTFFKTYVKNEMSKNDIIINFGIGLGYLLDETYITYSSRIIVYEPDINILHFVLSNVDFTEILSERDVFITDKLDEVMEYLSNKYISGDKVEVAYLKNYAVIKNAELIELTQKVYEACKNKMVDVNTIAKFSRQWLVNTLQNISITNNTRTYALAELEDKFVNKTALILAAGPSLQENIEFIKANRANYVIFAVNKVLLTLAQNGITPDFAVFLDSMHIYNTISSLNDEYCNNINCIFDIKTDSAIFTKKFKRYFVTFSDKEIIVKHLAKYNSFMKSYECGGSASTLALVSAVKMGFSRIIFAGLDLALNNSIAYASGEEIKRIDNSTIKLGTQEKKITQVKSVTGTMVETREDYEVFIKHFEALIKELKHPEIYNTTSFGAYIEGMKNSPIEKLSTSLNHSNMETCFFNLTPINFNVAQWSKDETSKLNNIVELTAKGSTPNELISAVASSSLMYQYLQKDILSVLNARLDSERISELTNSIKTALKDVIGLLQTNKLL